MPPAAPLKQGAVQKAVVVEQKWPAPLGRRCGASTCGLGYPRAGRSPRTWAPRALCSPAFLRGRCTRGSVYLCLREELCGAVSSSREESQGRAAFCSRADPSTALGAGACELRHRRPALDARSNHEPATRLCKVLKTPRSPPGGTHLLEVPLISTPRYTAHAFLQLLQTQGLQRTAHEFTVCTVPTL